MRPDLEKYVAQRESAGMTRNDIIAELIATGNWTYSQLQKEGLAPATPATPMAPRKNNRLLKASVLAIVVVFAIALGLAYFSKKATPAVATSTYASSSFTFLYPSAWKIIDGAQIDSQDLSTPATYEPKTPHMFFDAQRYADMQTKLGLPVTGAFSFSTAAAIPEYASMTIASLGSTDAHQAALSRTTLTCDQGGTPSSSKGPSDSSRVSQIDLAHQTAYLVMPATKCTDLVLFVQEKTNSSDSVFIKFAGATSLSGLSSDQKIVLNSLNAL